MSCHVIIVVTKEVWPMYYTILLYLVLKYIIIPAPYVVLMIPCTTHSTNMICGLHSTYMIHGSIYSTNIVPNTTHNINMLSSTTLNNNMIHSTLQY